MQVLFKEYGPTLEGLWYHGNMKWAQILRTTHAESFAEIIVAFGKDTICTTGHPKRNDEE